MIIALRSFYDTLKNILTVNYGLFLFDQNNDHVDRYIRLSSAAFHRTFPSISGLFGLGVLPMVAR